MKPDEKKEVEVELKDIEKMDSELWISHIEIVRLLEIVANLEMNEINPDMKKIYKISRMQLYKMMKFELNSS